MTFQELNLIAPLLESLTNQQYTQPTPIQEQAIPHVLAGKDIFGCAQTGTGKTAAFALPILQLLTLNKTQNNPGIKALVLAPTRELALQISESFLAYGKKLNIKHTVVFGGVSQQGQVNAVRRGVDVLIATPGRLLDLMQQGHIKLNTVEYLVLDEADRMLDMGFINDIKKIISKVPQKKQTILFSATAPFEIKKLADSFMKSPVTITIEPVVSTANLIKQGVYYVTQTNKKALLNHILSDSSIENAIVFTRTKRGADKVVQELTRNHIKSEAIHGNKSQGAREKALRGFKNKTTRILVATDIASRGIDIDGLSHVINFELPEVAETYVHRIGRTGRAGESGTAVSFCSPEEMPYLRNISKLLRKNIDVLANHPFANINAPAITENIARPAGNAQRHSGRKRSYKPARSY